MRILFVMSSFEADTAEAAEAKMTIAALLELGVVVGATYVQSIGNAVSDHPQFVPCPVPRGKRFSGAAIKSAIQAFKPDLAHIVACWNPFHVRVSDVLRKLGIPYLMEPGGGMAPIGLDYRFAEKPCYWYHRVARRFYKYFFDRRMVRNATFIRSMSPYETSELRRHFALDSEVLTLGFNPEWVTAVRLRRENAGQPLRFLFLGRVEIFQKGLDLILDAVTKLNAEGLASAFTVTIAGPEVNHSFTRIPARLLRDGITNVTLRGAAYGDEKQQLFAAADVFLHPSRYEQIAKMAREATGAGLPVIASRESNYGDWVQDYGLGISVALDAGELARAMKTFIDHPETALAMGKSGVDFARTWAWSKVATELREMYAKVLSAT